MILINYLFKPTFYVVRRFSYGGDYTMFSIGNRQDTVLYENNVCNSQRMPDCQYQLAQTLLYCSNVSRFLHVLYCQLCIIYFYITFFVAVDDFIMEDRDAERKYKFNLKESLAKAKTTKLLDGYNVLVTTSVKPSPPEMKGIFLFISVILLQML